MLARNTVRLRMDPGDGHAGVLLRLRVAHFSAEYDSDTFWAEVKVTNPDDQGLRSDDGFEVVAQFDFSFYEIMKVGFEEMKRKPDEYSFNGCPEVWRGYGRRRGEAPQAPPQSVLT